MIIMNSAMSKWSYRANANCTKDVIYELIDESIDKVIEFRGCILYNPSNYTYTDAMIDRKIAYESDYTGIEASTNELFYSEFFDRETLEEFVLCLYEQLRRKFSKDIAVVASVDGCNCTVRFFSSHAGEALWFSTEVEKYKEPIIIVVSDSMMVRRGYRNP